MRTVVLGILVVACVVIAAPCAAGPDRTEIPALKGTSSIAANNDLIAATATVGEKYQMVTVIDPKSRVMSVYQIDLTSGKITLRSVRQIQWDLQITDFNGSYPSPREIQSLLDPK
ncbi:MAG: hypothetical protein ACLQNE_40715 [Thermoguttaceae bacterium]